MKKHLNNILKLTGYIALGIGIVISILIIVVSTIEALTSPNLAEARELAYHLFLAILLLIIFASILYGIGAIVYFTFLLIKKLWTQ